MYPSSYSGYPEAAGYPPQQGYPPAQPGYYPPQPGYPAQPGYPSYPSSGYPPQQSGYPAPGYEAQPGYPSQSGYPPPSEYSVQPGYAQPPGGGYGYVPQGYPSYPQPGAPPQGYSSYQQPLAQTEQYTCSYMATVQKPVVPDDKKEAFVKLAGTDGEIDAFELKDILSNEFSKDFKFQEFTTDLTRSMVAMRDMDMSGKLDFDDYQRLWADLLMCKRAFMALDYDNSGTFNKSEFHRALETLGLKVDEKTERAMIVRYSDKAGNICFNDFVACYIKLKTMLKSFRTKDLYNQQNAEFQLDELIQLCMYS